jgi:hypothetical protein
MPQLPQRIDHEDQLPLSGCPRFGASRPDSFRFSPPYGMGIAFFSGLALFFVVWFWLCERFPRTLLVISMLLFGGRRR